MRSLQQGVHTIMITMIIVLRNIVFYTILFLSLPDQVFCKTRGHIHKPPSNKNNISSLSNVSNLSNFYDISNFIEITENQKEIPKGLLKAVIRQESDFNPRAYLGGSYGLGQVTLGTARTYCDIQHSKRLYEYKTNISCAGIILKALLNKYNNQKYYALSAYNIGTPFVCNGKTYQRNLGRHRIETLSEPCNHKGKVSNEKYVKDVIRHWNKYKA